MNFFKKNIFIVSSVVLMSGCSILNPYSDEFMCPNVSKGACTSVESAYKNSTNSLISKDTSLPKETALNEKSEDSSGRNALLSKIIDNPELPIMSPPEIARVLILPYSTENGSRMYGERYAYIITKPASFNILTTNEID